MKRRRSEKETAGLLKKLVTHGVRLIVYGLPATIVLILIFGAFYINHGADLKVWHEVELKSEFTKNSRIADFAQYLALEEKLFEEVETRVYGAIEDEDKHLLNRYNRGSVSDPGRWQRDWNRTFEFDVPSPRAGMLLLHGMSDSPYSLRTIAERFRARDVWSIGLRIPGHGTAPSGLATVKWEDMAAAVKLAMKRLREKVKEGPLYIVGYSNGGALAVEYALEALEDPEMPRPAKLILVSPAIGVSRMAGLAVWQGRLGWALRLKKLSWVSILPEYDPFKYGSFAINAGHQVHRLTVDIRKRIQRLKTKNLLDEFPPVLAFQSVADSTVSTPALVSGLFDHLPNGGNELVLFDINRSLKLEPLLVSDPGKAVEKLLRESKRCYTVSVVSNEGGDRNVVSVYTWVPGADAVSVAPTSHRWPRDIYSLAHISLPFAKDDPLYGIEPSENNIAAGYTLGNITPRGERGLLRISPADLLRLRWNPFYPILRERIDQFCEVP